MAGKNHEGDAAACYGSTPPSVPNALTRGSHVHYQLVIRLYFAALCVSTAFRIYEMGVLSAVMPDVKHSLRLTYSMEGTVASCVEYGLIPGALFAGMFFAYVGVRAHWAIVLLLLCIGCSMVVCALHPSFTALITARAFGGLCWAPVAVHCTVWINANAPGDHRTMWMGILGIVTMAGNLLGFLAGTFSASWRLPYQVGGWLMVGCALCICPFRGISTVTTGMPTCSSIVALLKSPIYWMIIGWNSCLCGLIGFFLYFAMQICENRGLSLYASRVFIMVFVVLAMPAVIGGGFCVDRLGGYRNIRASFGVLVCCSLGSVLGSIAFYLSMKLESPALFVVAVYGVDIAGAFPGSAVNGMITSLVPGTSHVATGLQFALQNVAKLLVPQAAGILVDHLGIGMGSLVAFFSTSCIGLVCAVLGYRKACTEQAATDSLLIAGGG